MMRADEDDQPDPVEGWPPGRSESFLSALTTGAASPTIDCQGTRPVSTTATAT